MLVALIVHFDIVERVRSALPKGERERKAETEAYICDLLEQGFAVTKHCDTEQQRVEHHIGMGFCAPARDSGMIGRIGMRLGLHWGTRKKRAGEEKGRPFAFDQAIDRRAPFNAAAKLRAEPLKAGETVLSHGDLCELTQITPPSEARLLQAKSHCLASKAAADFECCLGHCQRARVCQRSEPQAQEGSQARQVWMRPSRSPVVSE